MSGVLIYPDRPAADVAELGQQVWRLIPQMERVIIRDVTVNTYETPIAHGMNSIPRMVIVLPQVDARVWKSTASDGRAVFLTASATVVCDLEIVR